MMQATDSGSRHDRAHLGALDGSHVGRVLLEREVSSGAVMVGEVAGEDPAQVPLAQDEDMIPDMVGGERAPRLRSILSSASSSDKAEPRGSQQHIAERGLGPFRAMNP